jgi:hypothetical protein
MTLLGPAAMLLSFDVADEALSEHDHWHPDAQLPERLSISGILRGERWATLSRGPRCCVLCEVVHEVLNAVAHLPRRDHPGPCAAGNA